MVEQFHPLVVFADAEYPFTERGPDPDAPESIPGGRANASPPKIETREKPRTPSNWYFEVLEELEGPDLDMFEQFQDKGYDLIDEAYADLQRHKQYKCTVGNLARFTATFIKTLIESQTPQRPRFRRQPNGSASVASAG
ncbi:MAG: hypothetical protein HOO67_03855 [Candidatus Peribacteraceae bacterium]|nr:hypothetical protein [Candidatus Peribacteraceae bacterium]